MDATDYKIIDILQKEGRISMKDLATKVSLSPPAAAERVKRLEESGIVQGYKAIVSKEKLQRNINVLINVAMKVHKQDSFKEFVETDNRIIECHHVTGPYCMILRASVDKMDNLERLIGKIQEFGDTETFIILSSPVENKVLEPLGL